MESRSARVKAETKVCAPEISIFEETNILIKEMCCGGEREQRKDREAATEDVGSRKRRIVSHCFSETSKREPVSETFFDPNFMKFNRMVAIFLLYPV